MVSYFSVILLRFAFLSTNEKSLAERLAHLSNEKDFVADGLCCRMKHRSDKGRCW